MIPTGIAHAERLFSTTVIPKAAYAPPNAIAPTAISGSKWRMGLNFRVGNEWSMSYSLVEQRHFCERNFCKRQRRSMAGKTGG